MSERPPILVLSNSVPAAGEALAGERLQATSMAQALALLRNQPLGGVFLATNSADSKERVLQLFQSEELLDELCEGVVLVDPQMQVHWANRRFQEWCGSPPRGRGFYEVLGTPQILGPEYAPFHTALADQHTVTTRLQCRPDFYLELLVTPVHDFRGKPFQMICLVRDVTALVHQQQKLTALHQAGQQLSALSSDQLSEMSVQERIELLKMNIRHFTRDLLQYDVVEVRLLDRATNRLEPLLEEGMLPEAAQRVLYCSDKGNGVTGFVAATAKSYICTDTATDPLYIEGAAGAKSSMTVPLLYHDQVIGTFNVESPRPSAFGEDDLQFVEIFCREIASALHMLELLSAEKRSTASRSIELIGREVAMPVDDILAAAAEVLDRYIGHEPAMADKLKQILASARTVKQRIQKVGEDLAPPAVASPETGRPRLKGLRVLVADSDERVRKSAHGILGSFGCIVETARDGQQALTMARQSNYNAILVDIRLPDITGYDAFCKLREIQPHSRVILMTSFGYDPSHAIVKCRQEGLGSVLYKPFRIDQLIDALEKQDAKAPAEPLRA